MTSYKFTIPWYRELMV